MHFLNSLNVYSINETEGAHLFNYDIEDIASVIAKQRAIGGNLCCR